MALVNYRISDNVILRQFNNPPAQEFFVKNNHFILANQKSWDSAVWVTGEFEKCVNKTYTNTGLVPYPETEPTYHDCTLFEVMLKQHYRLDNLYGLHLIIANLKTGEILFSQMLYEDDFHVTSDKLLIDGSFWMTSTKIYVPGNVNSGVVAATITEIDFDSINPENGYLYNFTAPNIPLQPDNILSQNIQTRLLLDENFYLKIAMYNNSNTSIEQALREEFGILDNELAEFDITHDISYGNDNVGWQSITVKNNNDKYGLITLGLNMLPFVDIITADNLQQTNLEIIVQTNIQYNNGEPMQRVNTLITDIKSVLNPLIPKIAELQYPTTIYPVEVKVETNIVQTAINRNKELDVRRIFHPIYIETLKKDFVYGKKNIAFENLLQPAYMVIEKNGNIDKQTIFSKQTADNKYYFDITDIIPPSKNAHYELWDESMQYMIGNGMILLSADIPENEISTDTM